MSADDIPHGMRDFPLASYTEALRRRQIREFAYTHRRPGDYVEDHLIPLELSGGLSGPRNLWPQLKLAHGGWGAGRKDDLEPVPNLLVYSGTLGYALLRRKVAG
ncbi:MAG: hypothetical protein J2P48_09475 [Alphaproteobacteria bacterium]|nr:hypothetical protein [Alphaproteobacteria bacterium]